MREVERWVEGGGKNKKQEEGGKASQVAAGGPEQRLVFSLLSFFLFAFPDPSSALAFPFHLFLTSPLNFPSLPPFLFYLLSHFFHVLGLSFTNTPAVSGEE